jgi:2-dehydro-3-deoxygluconokinase
LDLSVFLQCETIEDAIKKYPNVDYWIVRNREAISNNRHVVTATIYHDFKFYRQNPIEFDVFEKVGGGDAFASGILHKLLQGETLKNILDFGLDCFIIKHTIAGDVLTLPESNITKSMSSSTIVNR